MLSLVLPAINLGILIVILVWKLREPLRHFVKNRHTQLLDELKNAKTRLHEAQEKYEEFTAKLKAVDAEVSAIWDQSRQEAEAAKNRIINEARRLGAMISADAKTTSQSLIEETKFQMRSDLGMAVLIKTEKLLKEKMTSQDKAQITQEFIKQMSGVQ